MLRHCQGEVNPERKAWLSVVSLTADRVSSRSLVERTRARRHRRSTSNTKASRTTLA